jgi:hypothetical protein
LTGSRTAAQPLGSLASASISSAAPAAPGSSAFQTKSDLQHSPSVGFRSAVQQAFDRDDAQSTTDNSSIRRSDTASTGTSNISPIIKQSTSFQSINNASAGAGLPALPEKSATETPLLSNRGSIMRKKLPGSGSTNKESTPPLPAPIETKFEPGYRRSLDPPTSGITPTHHPVVVESSPSSKRLSGPMVAETVDEADSAPATSTASLSKAEEDKEAAGIIPLSLRIGSDKGLREADLADTINNNKSATSPITNNGEQLSTPAIAEAVRASRHLFLDDHPANPNTPQTPTAAKNLAAISSPSPTHSARSNSPTKGRVRDLADQLEARSRRNSASSIGSASSPTKTTATLVSSYIENSAPGCSPRPEAATREPSFIKPDMPGAWISSAPTPATEVPPFKTTGISPSLEQSDLTPTTKKVQLQEITPSFAPNPTASSAPDDVTSTNALDAVKNAGAQLGSSLLATVGLGHQTKDFGDSSQEQSRADASSTFISDSSRPVIGQRGAAPPPLDRYDSENTLGASSAASGSIAGTLSAMYTAGAAAAAAGVAGTYFATGASQPDNSSVAGAQGDTPAPLRLNSTAKDLPGVPPKDIPGEGRFPAPQHTLTSNSSASPTDENSNESDRLRREIIRGLGAETSSTAPTPNSEVEKSEAAKDDRQRIQDALDASAAAAAFKGLDSKPLLDQRFSWETRPSHKQQASVSEYLLPKSQYTPRSRPNSPSALKTSFGSDAAPAREDVKSPEIKPVAAYERPRNKELAVVNAKIDVESPTTESTPTVVIPAIKTTEEPDTARSASALPKIQTNRSQENLQPAYITTTAHSPVSLRSPSPNSLDKSDLRPTSYYLSDLSPEALINDESEHGIDIVALRSDSVASSYVADDLPDLPEIHAEPTDNTDAASEFTQFTATPTIVPTTTSAGPPVPAFKTILAIPDAPTRIATYTATRQTFSTMNTGLDSWITGMIARNPAYEKLEPAPPQAIPSGSGALGTLRRAAVGATGGSTGLGHGHHRQSPSITLGKLSTRFGGNNANDDDNTAPPASPSPYHQHNDNSASSATGTNASPAGMAVPKVVDMDKMQQRGKDFMKSAGVFGGKAQAGALGLLAKGRNRLAGGKEGGGGGKVE